MGGGPACCVQFWELITPCWALGCFLCRWFISTRKRKCRSFLFSLPIMTWRPPSRPPSLISRWVATPRAGSKELHCEGVVRGRRLGRVVIASERVNFSVPLCSEVFKNAFLHESALLWCWLNVTGDIWCRRRCCFCLCFFFFCLSGIKSGWQPFLTSWPVNPLGALNKLLISSFTSAPLTSCLNLGYPVCAHVWTCVHVSSFPSKTHHLLRPRPRAHSLILHIDWCVCMATVCR